MSLHQTSSWFDCWVEVSWESRNGKNYSVPAKLLLWGNVMYSDGTETLLESVCLLRSTKNMSTIIACFLSQVITYVMRRRD